MLSPLKVDANATVPLTLVPAFPTYPPETSWMRQPKSDIPGLVLSQHGTRAWRICRRTSIAATRGSISPITRDCWPTWSGGPAAGIIPLVGTGPGLIDCHLYEQPGRMILHLVNLTSEATWRRR